MCKDVVDWEPEFTRRSKCLNVYEELCRQHSFINAFVHETWIVEYVLISISVCQNNKESRMESAVSNRRKTGITKHCYYCEFNINRNKLDVKIQISFCALGRLFEVLYSRIFELRKLKDNCESKRQVGSCNCSNIIVSCSLGYKRIYVSFALGEHLKFFIATTLGEKVDFEFSVDERSPEANVVVVRAAGFICSETVRLFSTRLVKMRHFCSLHFVG